MQECIDARGVFVTLDCCTLCTVSTVEESPLAQHIVQPNSMVIYLVVRRGYHLILRFAVSGVGAPRRVDRLGWFALCFDG
jgi:hypothetical protein